ncbi:hypothetical protein E4U32_000502 [Claviceps aff. humidiphila group G2b]|nr:hypothetical protein E4U32_000502 [Claviceps aff. humidiphila group G2b]
MLRKCVDAWKKWDADEFIADLLPIAQQLDVKHIVHDASKGKACIYAVARANAPCGDYKNEQAIFITFSESGDKIETMEEMNDNAFRKEWTASQGEGGGRFLEWDCENAVLGMGFLRHIIAGV